MNKVIDFCRQRQIPYETNASLARCCTFRIGGSASCLIRPRSADEFCELLDFFRRTEQRFRVIGRGSNLLFSDRHIDFPIVCTTQMTDLACTDGSWRAACGVSLRQLILTAAGQGFGGQEELYGIPGTVGGAVFMNAGAYGNEICRYLSRVRCFDFESGERRVLTKEELGFAYRTSILQARWLYLLDADFALPEANPASVRDAIRAVTRKRTASQPLGEPSAGSVFKRTERGAAWQLIDGVGLRGYRIGGAAFSELHAGFIVNRGGATAEDVLALIGEARKRVAEKYGVGLACELEFIGEEFSSS